MNDSFRRAIPRTIGSLISRIGTGAPLKGNARIWFSACFPVIQHIGETSMKLFSNWNLKKVALSALFATGLTVFPGISFAIPQEKEDQKKVESKKTEEFGVGSKAPELDIEHWLSDGKGKFKKVTSFADGNIYVVEFWATWCGPCIASMPHLAEMQEKLAEKKVQIISVSDEDLETVEGFLKRELPSDDEKTYADLTSAYCLTADPDKSVYKDYMLAAKQNGIPTAFIVGKKGIIE